MRLDDSNKILFDYIFIYTLAAKYKINLNNESAHKQNVTSISE